MKLSVEGKNAIVTGGARGLGYFCSEILVKGGIKNLFMSSRSMDTLQEAKKQLEELIAKEKLPCENIYVFANDLSDSKGVYTFMEQVKEKTDHIDILILNSGASWGAPLEKHPEKALHKVINLNVIGLFLTVQLFKPMMLKNATQSSPSRILLMSSVAGIINSFPGAGTYGYQMSKLAVTHLGRTLAIELGYQNINVNVLCPGFFETKMSLGLLKVMGDFVSKTTPRRRYGTKEDIQSVVLYMCDESSNFLNGVVLPIDGGNYLVGAGNAAKL